MKILVADDEQLTRQLTAALLKIAANAEVIEAESGDDALRKIHSQDFDLLLLDWNMPGKSGLEIVKSLRDSEPRVPVIMVTSNSGREMVIEALKAGVVDYIIKPFEPEYLLSKVAKITTAVRAALPSSVQAASAPASEAEASTA